MRVLFINENIGGHRTVHIHLAAALRGRPDIEAEFLNVPPPSLVRRAAGVRAPVLGRLDLDLQPLRAQLALSAHVRRRLRRRLDDFDVIHLYTHNAGLLSFDLLGRRPTVVTLDGTNAMNAYQLPYRAPTRFTPHALKVTQLFERRVYAAATAIVANSGWVAASLRADYGVTDARLHVIPFGIRAPRFDPPAAPGTGRHRMPRLIFIGHSLERKGGNRLLRLHQRHFADRCELVLVTKDRVDESRNVTLVPDLHPGDGRLWDLLRGCACLVLPSEIDQAPNAVLEAMAAGVPVVAFPTGAVPEMVADGHTGRLVAPGDDEGLAAALEGLLDDVDRRVAMGAAGRQRFLERYDAEVAVHRLVSVLELAVAAHRSG